MTDMPPGGYDTEDAPDDGAVDRRDGWERSERWTRFTDIVNQMLNRQESATARIEWSAIAIVAAAVLFLLGALVLLLVEIWAR